MLRRELRLPATCLRNLGEQRLDLRIPIPLFSFVFEDEIRSHAAACEFLHTFVILGAICVRIEVSWPVVPNILQKLHEPECSLRVSRTKPQILIVATGYLIVEIDVEELTR